MLDWPQELTDKGICPMCGYPFTKHGDYDELWNPAPTVWTDVARQVVHPVYPQIFGGRPVVVNDA